MQTSLKQHIKSLVL